MMRGSEQRRERSEELKKRNRPSVRETHLTAPTLFIRAARTRFAYRRFGTPSGLPLLFLQEYRATMDNWDPMVVDGLGAHRQVILFDNRGIGRSSGTSPDNVSAMGRDVIAFLEALGIEQVDLLGFSLGGMVAQQVLAERPDLVRRAILVATGPPGAVDIFVENVIWAATKVGYGAEELLSLFFEPTQTSQDAGRRFIQRMMARSDREPPTTEQTMQAQLAAIHSWGAAVDNPARLNAIEQPILVVNGRRDILVPTVNAFVLSQYFPNAQLILYPGAGHGCMYQYPERFVEDASRFLARD
jgi:pimeloyl-ACP methyl ester carboxylesterase